MKKYKPEVELDIEPLDQSFNWINLYNKVNSIDSTMNKLIRKDLIEGTKKVLPLIFLLVTLFSDVYIVRIICSLLTLISSGEYIYKEIKSDNKDEEIEIEEKRTIEDYYTDSFKKVLETEDLESDIKYEEALEKQRQKNRQRFYAVDKKPYLDKEETINFMTSTIELYYSCYLLPKLNIEDKEWDIFYDILYSNIEQIGLKKEYSEICSTIIKYTFSKCMINNQEEIVIQDFINTMELLESKYGICNLDFTKRQILNIQKEVISSLSNLKNKKILSFRNKEDSID